MSKETVVKDRFNQDVWKVFEKIKYVLLAGSYKNDASIPYSFKDSLLSSDNTELDTLEIKEELIALEGLIKIGVIDKSSYESLKSCAKLVGLKERFNDSLIEDCLKKQFVLKIIRSEFDELYEMYEQGTGCLDNRNGEIVVVNQKFRKGKASGAVKQIDVGGNEVEHGVVFNRKEKKILKIKDKDFQTPKSISRIIIAALEKHPQPSSLTSIKKLGGFKAEEKSLDKYIRPANKDSLNQLGYEIFLRFEDEGIKYIKLNV